MTEGVFWKDPNVVSHPDLQTFLSHDPRSLCSQALTTMTHLCHSAPSETLRCPHLTQPPPAGPNWTGSASPAEQMIQQTRGSELRSTHSWNQNPKPKWTSYTGRGGDVKARISIFKQTLSKRAGGPLHCLHTVIPHESGG